MKTKEHREEVLKSIARVWDAYPELRLMQLILNIYRSEDLYFKEDKKICYDLERFYKPDTRPNIDKRNDNEAISYDYPESEQ